MFELVCEDGPREMRQDEIEAFSATGLVIPESLIFMSAQHRFWTEGRIHNFHMDWFEDGLVKSANDVIDLDEFYNPSSVTLSQAGLDRTVLRYLGNLVEPAAEAAGYDFMIRLTRKSDIVARASASFVKRHEYVTKQAGLEPLYEVVVSCHDIEDTYRSGITLHGDFIDALDAALDDRRAIDERIAEELAVDEIEDDRTYSHKIAVGALAVGKGGGLDPEPRALRRSPADVYLDCIS